MNKVAKEIHFSLSHKIRKELKTKADEKKVQKTKINKEINQMMKNPITRNYTNKESSIPAILYDPEAHHG